MGLSLLLSLLLLPTCLQAGECPGHPGSAPGPSESPGRAVAGKLEKGSAGVTGQASQPQQAMVLGQCQPFTLLPSPSLARCTQAREPVLPPVTLLAWVRVQKVWGYLLHLSQWLESLSSPPSCR